MPPSPSNNKSMYQMIKAKGGGETKAFWIKLKKTALLIESDMPTLQTYSRVQTENSFTLTKILNYLINGNILGS